MINEQPFYNIFKYWPFFAFKVTLLKSIIVYLTSFWRNRFTYIYQMPLSLIWHHFRNVWKQKIKQNLIKSHKMWKIRQLTHFSFINLLKFSPFLFVWSLWNLLKVNRGNYSIEKWWTFYKIWDRMINKQPFYNIFKY